MSAMDEIRVPRAGLEWISDAFHGPAPACTLHQVPSGVIFDAVALTSAFGRAVLDRLIDEGRHSGPVILDGIRHRVVFLVAPGAEPDLELLRIENRIPRPLPMEVTGLGGAVRLPALVTRQDAVRRWLIAPRSRTPRLTDLEDLATTVGECVRQRLSQTAHPALSLHSVQTEFPAPDWCSWSAARSAFSA
jgi:hypothetical protein